MSLYKDPKRKRIQDEDEILRQYRASMNKPKRRYKQRKSKYDPVIWDALPLHKSSKRMEYQDGKLIKDSKAKSNVNPGMELTGTKSQSTSSALYSEKNSFGKFITLQTQLQIPFMQELSTSNKEGNEMSIGKEKTDIGHTCTLEQSENIMDDNGNTLLVRKILGFLLDDNNVVDKRNMLHTLMLDTRLKNACLTEIQKRSQYLSTVREIILPKLKKEETLLLGVIKYLNPCQATVTIANACTTNEDPKNRDTNHPKNKNTDDLAMEHVQVETLSFLTSVDDSNAGNEKFKHQTQKSTASLLPFDQTFYYDSHSGSVELQATNNEGISLNLERDIDIVEANIDSFQGWSGMDDFPLMSPKRIEKDNENTNYEVVSEMVKDLESINDFRSLFPSQLMINEADTNENKVIHYADNNMPNSMQITMPNNMANSMQNTMLDDMANSMPNTIPNIMPHSMPNTMPDDMPNMPNTMPNIMPHSMPNMIPDDMPNSMPNTMPDDMPHSMPNTMPDDMPNTMHDDMHHSMPNTMPDDMPNSMPNTMPNIMPHSMPNMIPDDMPNSMPNTMPDDMPHSMPNTMPDDMPNTIPDDMHHSMPNTMPDDMPNSMPNTMPNHVVDFESIHSSGDSNTAEMLRLAEIIANST